ncbi:MAG: WD40 repeat domain-containing protein [Planctomycetes bacterium]|nr:WD40 repeat domain-containing protein [Planctomycetota bacterium]
MGADPKQTYVAVDYKYEAPFITCRFDPKGRYVFGAAEDRSVVRWELATGKQTVLKGHDSWVGDLAFTPDGETLITAGYDDTLMWWPVAAEKPEPLRKVEAHKGWIRAAAVSPCGNYLASAGNDGKVKLWYLSDGAPLRTLEGHDNHVYSLMFHPTVPCVISGDLLGNVHQWDLATGERVRSFDAKPLWSYNAGQGVDFGGVRSLSMSPDGKHLACSGLHKAENPLGAVHEPLVLRFEWETGKLLVSHTLAGQKSVAWRARFHPEGFLIGGSGGGAGGHLLFWNQEDKPFHTFKLPDTVREFDLHPDGIQLATAHYGKMVRLSRMAAKPAPAR